MKKTYNYDYNQYNKDHYDRITVLVPKGERKEIQERAKDAGMSLSGYIVYLLNADK